MSVLFLTCVLMAPPAKTADIGNAILAIHKVGAEGSGSIEAGAAWRQLAKLPPEQLPLLLAGMDGANDLASNYLRAAVDSMAERAIRAGKPLPIDELKSFVLDRRHSPRPRRLAYELLAQADAGLAKGLVARMIDDPSVELRREAVSDVIAAANSARAEGKKETALALDRQAFEAARDIDQIKSQAERLKGLGQPVDLPGHFGFILNWWLIGPFDHHQGIGFPKAYPPELEVRLDLEYPGKSGPVRWKAQGTADPFGVVDLNKAIGKANGVVAYAWTEFQSPEDRPAEIRLGTHNGFKVWLNGQLLFGREEYHMGMEIDQYRVPCQLRRGKNNLLLKICQNEQTESWAQTWSFQLRVCDSVGTPVATATTPPASGKEKSRPES